MRKQQYIGHSVSWVLRLNLLHFRTNWSYMHTLRMGLGLKLGLGLGFYVRVRLRVRVFICISHYENV